jgi:rhodanese-related sulfurtransferase
MKKSFLLISLLWLIVNLVGCTSEKSNSGSLNEMTVAELLEIYETTGFNFEDTMYIDVREVGEYNEGYIEGFEGLPKSTFECYIEDIPHDKELVLICNTQNRSRAVAEMLGEEYGFNLDNITIVNGGVSSWNGPISKK